MAGDLDWHDFLSLSFSHHDEILAKTDTLEERAFYIHQAATLHWDKYTLRNNLKADLFHHQSQMPNNFVSTMPSTRHAAKVIKTNKGKWLTHNYGYSHLPLLFIFFWKSQLPVTTLVAANSLDISFCF